MMRIRWALAQLLYWIGHACYKLDCGIVDRLHPKGLEWEDYVIWQNSLHGRTVDFFTGWVGWSYQRFMVWSIEVQGFGPGPWTQKAEDEHGAFRD